MALRSSPQLLQKLPLEDKDKAREGEVYKNYHLSKCIYCAKWLKNDTPHYPLDQIRRHLGLDDSSSDDTLFHYSSDTSVLSLSVANPQKYVEETRSNSSYEDKNLHQKEEEKSLGSGSFD